jgi:flagellar basal body rod protein FlgG
MVNGLYSAGAGMMLTMRKQDVTTNNIANAQTTGFKISRLVTHATVESRRDADQYMRQRENQREDEVHVDWQPGPLIQTGNALDVSLRGDGFLAISSPNGERYLRSAALKVNGDRELVDNSGANVLDSAGNNIKLPGQKTTITADGRVMSDGAEIATLKLVDFPKPYTLREEGNNRWVPYGQNPSDPAPKPIPVGENTRIEQGFLEGPNVNTVSEMVRMISQLRNYEADSKVLHAIDGTIDKAVNQVGRV